LQLILIAKPAILIGFGLPMLLWEQITSLIYFGSRVMPSGVFAGFAFLGK